MNQNLTITRAANNTFAIQVVQGGSPLNCTGGTLRFTAKWAVTDLDSSAVFSITSPTQILWTLQSSGQAVVNIASTLTDIDSVPYHTVNLPYDLRFTDVSGVVATVMAGTLTIQPNVSQTSP